MAASPLHFSPHGGGSGSAEAFVCVNLVDRLPESVECMETWDHTIAVGTTSGEKEERAGEHEREDRSFLVIFVF
jgi:hypothetical protein